MVELYVVLHLHPVHMNFVPDATIYYKEKFKGQE